MFSGNPAMGTAIKLRPPAIVRFCLAVLLSSGFLYFFVNYSDWIAAPFHKSESEPKVYQVNIKHRGKLYEIPLAYKNRPVPNDLVRNGTATDNLINLILASRYVDQFNYLVSKIKVRQKVLKREQGLDMFVNRFKQNQAISPLDVSEIQLLETPTVCKTSQPEILWYFYNMQTQAPRRTYLRKIFGKKKYNGGNLALLFTMGKIHKQSFETEASIRNESRYFGDVLYADFDESYLNLTNKAAVTINFIASHCPSVKYVIKSDDDTIINIDYFISRLSRQSPDTNYMLGVKGSSGVIRNPMGMGSKWFMNPLDFPIRSPDNYPYFCNGWAFGLTIGLLRQMRSRIPLEPKLWLDDVYVTGILTEHVPNTVREDISDFVYVPMYGSKGVDAGLMKLKRNSKKLPLVISEVETKYYEKWTTLILNLASGK